MSALTSRERVLTALSHQQPDRVPFIFGVDLTTGIMRRAYQRLAAHLGIQAQDKVMYGSWRELGDACVDEAILIELGRCMARSCFTRERLSGGRYPKKT